MLPLYVAIGSFDCEGLGPFCATGSEAPTKIENLIVAVFGFLTLVAGVAFLIYFVIGGISWITAGGDTGAVDKAKKMMTGGLIGLVIITAAFAITWIVGKVLGLDILDFANTLNTLLGTGSSATNPGATQTPQ